MESGRRYLDVTTPIEWVFRIGLVISFLSLIGLLYSPGIKYTIASVSSSVLLTILCLAWNDQFEFSRNNGLVLSRTVFGIERRKVICVPAQLERVAIKTTRVPVKENFDVIPKWRTIYRVTVIDKRGKAIPVGHSHPRIEKTFAVTNWPQARVDANQEGQSVADALGIRFEPTYG